jgi:hypothetical protein
MQVLNHRCFEGDEADDGSTRRILATPQALLGHLLQETHKFHREKKKIVLPFICEQILFLSF